MTDRKLYDIGWDDCLQYTQDKHTLQQSQVGWGYLFLLLGTISTMLVITAPVMMWVIGQHVINWMPLVYAGLVGIVMITAGYFLEKRETVRFKEREKAHYKKWGDHWAELGFKGDE